MPGPCFLNEIPAPWMNDGDGYENVTYKVASHADVLRGSSCVTSAWKATYKVNMRCFKLYRTYSRLYQSSRRKRKLLPCVYFLHKT